VLQPGTYVQIDTVTGKPLPAGSQLVVLPGKNGRLGFSLNALRAATSGLGFVAGLLDGRTLPLTWSAEGQSGKCRLLFEAAPRSVKVTQDQAFGDCGFDAGVTANGTYALAAEKP
jgi:hypothetical protein